MKGSLAEPPPAILAGGASVCGWKLVFRMPLAYSGLNQICFGLY